ncbi:mannose-P-dolichol utilization defect 1 protein-like [Uloborus diversus]|uniref:mannose-P-dolichol utilization defect 1 protein-like n=1 Tax=Uloborus diversus TaxID=327109 RepID=UPI00240987EA|nr:mannose-P-dolichol utilization defect 1 protein-like [Uloborus diversus]
MAELFRQFLPLFISDKCMNEFFVKFNLLDADCLKQTISKALGTGIILGSTLVKLPQIIKIVNAKSAEGLSFLGILLELIAITSTASYNYAKGYPFSSWGESCFLLVETAIIGFLVLLYSSRIRQANTFALLYSVVSYILFNGLVPISVLWNMQVANVPIVVAGKMIQAAKNYQNGHTGQISAITVFLLFLGSMARIFTSIQETGDPVIIFTFIIATLANGVLAAQVLYYWKATARVLLEREKKKA